MGEISFGSPQVCPVAVAWVSHVVGVWVGGGGAWVDVWMLGVTSDDGFCVVHANLL